MDGDAQGPATKVPAILDGRYELGEQLGCGSTAIVWQARDLETNETVALKVLQPGALASPRAVKRFMREVASAQSLRHPHSVEVRSHGRISDGSGYLVMERLHGQTLAARLRQSGPLPQPQAIHIVAQVLDAVGAAHEQQLVHRDLKPGNVMLIERDGDPDFVKVCDFGLAKAIEGDERDADGDAGSLTTEQGAICGTPEYMAPEQARGEPIDARADLYAIAVMLYHVVVGQLPFSGRSALAIVSQHLASPPPRPSELRPDLKIFPPLESLILRALAKDKAERPSSAKVFRADLLQIARDYTRRRSQPSSTRVQVDDAPTLSPSSFHPGATLRRRTAVASAVGVALAGALAASWLVSRGAASSPSIEPPAATTNAPASPAPTESVARPGAPAPSPPERLDVATRPTAPPQSDPPAATKTPASRSALARASELLAEGKVGEACALAESEVARRPRSASGWKFLGQCRMRLGERSRAVAAYERYLELSPNAPDAVFIQGMTRAGP